MLFGAAAVRAGIVARCATCSRLRSAPAAIVIGVYCAMTGRRHRLFWMRSAWWCADCRQKVESCCEGGGCPSIADALLADPGAEHVAKRGGR